RISTDSCINSKSGSGNTMDSPPEDTIFGDGFLIRASALSIDLILIISHLSQLQKTKWNPMEKFSVPHHGELLEESR
ncbi:MAG: hypothetical protein ACYCRD_06060, partial [Leptospirillum sp.]